LYEKLNLVNARLITIFITIIMSLLSAIVLSLPFLNDRNAYAQNIIQNVSNTSNSTLFAVGNAQATIKPDKVTLSLSVETTNKTATAALFANSEAMNKVLNALKAGGVRENETSTSFFNISPNYKPIDQQQEGQYFPPIESRDIISYTVTNSITVDSYNLLNVSQWIDIAVQAGVNDVSSIYFSLSDEKSEAVKNDLLKQAITNAKGKADIAASALDLKVIGVKSISIEALGGFYPMQREPFLAQDATSAASAPAVRPPTPIIAGEQEVTSTVNIVFFLG
jgi:uncharacterized protein